MLALARLLLGPLLLTQGRRVRRVALRLPEPPGDRIGTAGSGPPLRLLIVGDSSAAGVGAATQTEALLGQAVATLAAQFTVSYRLIARTGATTRATLGKLQKTEPQPFDVALTALGVNDVTSGVSVADWLDQQQALAATLRTRFGVRHVVVSGLPPVHAFPALPQPLRWYLGTLAQRFDARLRLWADAEPQVSYVALTEGPDVPPDYLERMDEFMAEDGFHPGPQIYAHWGSQAAAEIARRMNAHVEA
ncbi:MAG: SGNH/GDSL hydrolase family protein [Bacteroidota bacterium]